MNKELNSRRRNSGNVLLFTCVGFTVLAICLLIAYSFCGVYFVHNRLQSTADEIALVGAKRLNRYDRLGKLNNMIARCRQSVYSSRQDYEKSEKDTPELTEFADQLLQETRESAGMLEAERKALLADAQEDAANAMLERFNAIKGSYNVSLPWLVLNSPRLRMIKMGRVDGVESNVTEFTQLEKLKDEDRSTDNVALSSGLNLYKANKDHKLPKDDADLSFNLAGLPPPIDGQIAPARTMLPNNFEENKSGLAPCCTQIIISLKVKTGLGSHAASTLYATGTAMTTGASNQL